MGLVSSPKYSRDEIQTSLQWKCCESVRVVISDLSAGGDVKPGSSLGELIRIV